MDAATRRKRQTGNVITFPVAIFFLSSRQLQLAIKFDF